MTKNINPEFLQGIRGAYQNVREHRVVSLLDVAASFDGSEADDGRLQQNYIDAALKLGNREFETVLRELFLQSNAPIADRSRAALLYLRGEEMGFWKLSPLNRRRARKIADLNMEAIDMPEPYRKPSPAPLSKLEAIEAKGDTLQLFLALEKAGAHMDRIARDPKTTPVMKLKAVQEYLRTLEFLQPGSWAKFCADNPDFIAAARDLARRTLQEAKS